MKKITSAVGHRLKLWLSYFLMVVAGLIAFLYFQVLNWTRIIGRKNVPRQGKQTLLVSNHLSMYDSFFVGIAAYWPEFILWPSLPPHHLAAKENFFKNWLTRTIFSLLRAIPVERSKKVNRELVTRVSNTLARANVHIFPQGRRSYDLTEVKTGVAHFIVTTHPTPTVIPIYFRGTDRLFGGGPGSKGISRWLPRPPFVGRKTLIVFGSPIDLSDLLLDPKNLNLYNEITKRIVEAIQDLATLDRAKSKIPV